MSKVHNAFKMPYRENETEKFESFDKHHVDSDEHAKAELYDHLFGDDDTEKNVILGYD